MSRTLSQELHSCKVLEDHLRGMVFNRNGVALSSRDNESFALAVSLQTLLLKDLLTGKTPNRHSRIVRWAIGASSIDCMCLSTFLKEMSTTLRNIEDGVFESYTDFKHRYRDVYPFIGEYFSPIKEEMESFLTTHSPVDFAIINQHLSFMSRLSLRDIDLTDQCIQEYVSNERVMANRRPRVYLEKNINDILREWFSDFSLDGFVPSHGNGAVAHSKVKTPLWKYCNLGIDARLQYFLNTFGDYRGFYPLDPCMLKRQCEVIFVPKNIQTWRVISKEPATLQYFQQGLFRLMDKHFQAHPIIRRHIRLHDQTINTNYAYIGSRDRTYATIDMSNASDSVHWDLVKSIFAGTPLLRGFLAMRSTEAILPDGSTIVLKKFAPMGSALCFPVMCIIFAAICEYVVRNSGIHFKDNPYTVYGDDVVIDSRLSEEFMFCLNSLGFSVNTAKSYTSPLKPFRESCGGEYFDGVDVSPFRLSRKFSGDTIDVRHPEIFSNYIDMANLAYRHNLKLVRLWFIHRLLDLPQRFNPYFSDDNRGIISDTPTNYRLVSRYSRDWQCTQYRCGCVVTDASSTSCVHDQEPIRLFDWLRAASMRHCTHIGPDDVIVANLCSPRSKLGSRFVSNS